MDGKKSLTGRLRVVSVQLKEGVTFTFNELKGNKLRTFLSLLGVSIGIFTIIAIFTAVDALRSNVKRGFETLGSSKMLQVSSWPMGVEDDEGNIALDGSVGTEYKWWEYIKRPNVSLDDYKYLKHNSEKGDDFLYSVMNNATVKYNRSSSSGVWVMSVIGGLDKVINLDMESGRVFTPTELESAQPIAILGKGLAESIFGDENPVGKVIKVNGYSVTVIGVIAKQGESMVNMMETDGNCILPYNTGKNIFHFRNMNGELYAVPKEDVSVEDFTAEIKHLMRQCRRLRVGQKNNFSINSINVLENMLGQIMGVIQKVGWIIAAFSLLIGGFGIANIMFVSVKERTKIIGIQKALGAKRYFIMTQFLTEALILAVAGALVGVLLVWIIITAAPIPAEYDVHLSFQNVIAGVLIASAIGVLSGVLPAWTAANLNPVTAMNSK